MELIFRILLWSIPIGIIIYLISVFTTPEITDFCSDSFVVCMESAQKLHWYEKYYMGSWCVLKNVGCVLSALF